MRVNRENHTEDRRVGVGRFRNVPMCCRWFWWFPLTVLLLLFALGLRPLTCACWGTMLLLLVLRVLLLEFWMRIQPCVVVEWETCLFLSPCFSNQTRILRMSRYSREPGRGGVVSGLFFLVWLWLWWWWWLWMIHNLKINDQ